MKCCCTYKDTGSIVSCITNTHANNYPYIHRVNTKILHCRHTFMHWHFFSLPSDYDLVSVHSSLLWLQSGSPGTPQAKFATVHSACMDVCVLKHYCHLFVNVSVLLCLCVEETLCWPKYFCTVLCVSV